MGLERSLGCPVESVERAPFLSMKTVRVHHQLCNPNPCEGPSCNNRHAASYVSLAPAPNNEVSHEVPKGDSRRVRGGFRFGFKERGCVKSVVGQCTDMQWASAHTL